jgi:hypothetical protein
MQNSRLFHAPHLALETIRTPIQIPSLQEEHLTLDDLIQDKILAVEETILNRLMTDRTSASCSLQANRQVRDVE